MHMYTGSCTSALTYLGIERPGGVTTWRAIVVCSSSFQQNIPEFPKTRERGSFDPKTIALGKGHGVADDHRDRPPRYLGLLWVGLIHVCFRSGTDVPCVHPYGFQTG